jgi:hypothetical protein
MDSFRHPAQLKLFLVISLLMLVAPPVDKIISVQLTPTERKRVKIVTFLTLGLLLITTLVFLFRSSTDSNLTTSDSLHQNGIKKIIEGLTLADGIVLNGAIQIIFLALFLFLIRKEIIPQRGFAVLWVSNLLVMAQLILPVTFVGKTSPSVINAVIHASPKGFPVTGLENSLLENSRDAFSAMKTSGLAYFYTKRPGISKITNSPSFLNQQDSFIASDKLYRHVASLPLAYWTDSVMSFRDTALLNPVSGACTVAILENNGNNSIASCDSTSMVRVTELASNRIKIHSRSRSPGRLVLTQNFHHYWKAATDNKPQQIDKTNLSFMSILLPAGEHSTVFHFYPRNTIHALWIQLFTGLLLFIAGTVSLFRQYRMRKPIK